MSGRNLSESVNTYYLPIDKGHHIYVSPDDSQFIISPPWNLLDKVSYARREKFFKGSIRTIVNYIKKIQKQEEPYALYYETHPDEFAMAPRYHISLDQTHSTSKQEISELEKIVDSEKEIREKKVSAWDSEKTDKIKQGVWAGRIPGTLFGLGLGIYFAMEYYLANPNKFSLDAEVIIPSLLTAIGFAIGLIAGEDIFLYEKDHRINIRQELNILKRLKVDKSYKG